jgi:hypothetical protein
VVWERRIFKHPRPAGRFALDLVAIMPLDQMIRLYANFAHSDTINEEGTKLRLMRMLRFAKMIRMFKLLRLRRITILLSKALDAVGIGKLSHGP